MLKRMMTALLCTLLPLTCLAEELSAPAPTAFTPGRESCGKPNCFWETPMDYTDAEAMWAMLTAPMTVIDGNFRTQVHLMAEPSRDSQEIGEITCASQGVHVLEHLENGWTKIECYSSSFKGSSTQAWNKLQTGYVETSCLKEVKVRTEFALVVDKLTQRLYVYRKGELFDELMVSTGLGTEDGPYNETRSGEFLLYSASGQFASEPYLCRYGIRYNDGDLLHEIPYLKRNGSRNYSHTEPHLGQRASHGCLRVQYKRTEKGLNMTWLWNNLKDQMKTRLVIWEDWQGRSIPVPSADTVLYYNPRKGESYHDSPTCYGVQDKYEPMTAFSYGELDTGDYTRLGRCVYCNPPLRAGAIAEINAEYAPNPAQPAGSPHWCILSENE